MNEQKPEELKSTTEGGELEESADQAPKEPTISAEEIIAMDKEAKTADAETDEKLTALRKKMGLEPPSLQESLAIAHSKGILHGLDTTDARSLEEARAADESRIAENPNEPKPMTPERQALENDAIRYLEKIKAEQLATDPEKEARQKARTAFEKELATGNLEGAEEKLKALFELTDEREMDHKSRALYKAAKAPGVENWDIAVIMINFARTAADRKARAEALPKDVQRQYSALLARHLEETVPPEIEAEEENSLEAMDKTKTSYFKELIKRDMFEEAEVWVLEHKDAKAGNTDWLNHVSLPLYRRYRDSGDLADAKKINEWLPDGDPGKEARIKDLTGRAGKPYEEI